MKRIKVAVLVSGGGTNLGALIKAQADGIIKSGEISLVISNKVGAYALERAKAAGIEAITVTKAECGSQQSFEDRLIAELRTEMRDAARRLEFERAAYLRDRIRELSEEGGSRP